MPDFVVNLGRSERKIQKKKNSKKINKNLNGLETYIFRTSSPRPLFWQSLGCFLYCMTVVDPFGKLLLMKKNAVKGIGNGFECWAYR